MAKLRVPLILLLSKATFIIEDVHTIKVQKDNNEDSDDFETYYITIAGSVNFWIKGIKDEKSANEIRIRISKAIAQESNLLDLRKDKDG